MAGYNNDYSIIPGHRISQLSKEGRGPKAIKAYGQHFLNDQDVLDKIVEASRLSGEDTVVEIGPGRGALTTCLSERSGKVLAFEIDSRMVEHLNSMFRENDNVVIYHEDVLKTDLNSVIQEICPNDCSGVKLVANIPYYITTPILEWAFRFQHLFDSAVIMVQSEVAKKIVAKPSTPEYGVLSLKSQYIADVEIVTEVPKSCFDPAPEVDSAVVRFDMKHRDDVEREMFFEFVEASFKQRRKNLRNSLKSSSLFNGDTDVVSDVIDKSGIDGSRRAESLSLEEFLAFFESYKLVCDR